MTCHCFREKFKYKKKNPQLLAIRHDLFYMPEKGSGAYQAATNTNNNELYEIIFKRPSSLEP